MIRNCGMSRGNCCILGSVTGTVCHSLALWVIHWHCGSFTGTLGHSQTLWVIHWNCGSFTCTVGHSLAQWVIHRHCGSFTGTVVVCSGMAAGKSGVRIALLVFQILYVFLQPVDTRLDFITSPCIEDHYGQILVGTEDANIPIFDYGDEYFITTYYRSPSLAEQVLTSRACANTINKVNIRHVPLARQLLP